MSHDHECITLLESDSDDDDYSIMQSVSTATTKKTRKKPAGSVKSTVALRRSKRQRKCTTSTSSSTITKVPRDSVSSVDAEELSGAESSDDSHAFDFSKSLLQRLRARTNKTAAPLTDGDGVKEPKATTDVLDDIVSTVSLSSSSSDTDTSNHDSDTNDDSDDIQSDKRQTATKKKRDDTIHAAESSSYLKTLKASLKKRTFPLSQIPRSETVSTGRTVKKMTAWKGQWPPLREFLQNTIDHLNLLDHRTGRRRACIDLDITNNTGSAKSKFTFSCDGRKICAMHVVSEDELIIDQAYTYPISSRALDTGVPDVSKAAGEDQAGGFGDGFKTAAVALMANAGRRNGVSDFKALKWYFYARKELTEVEWKFEGVTRNSVATFAKCDVLQVKIQKKTNVGTKSWEDDNDGESREGEEGQQYTMRQVVQAKGIGKSFIEEAVPKFVVFWDLNEASLLSTVSRRARSGGDSIGPVSSQPPIFNGLAPPFGSSKLLKPCTGIYVKGIWVRETKIKDTIMCFYGNRLEVTGRDRNEVDEDQLIDAVIHVLKNCSDMAYLGRLLQPLRGKQTMELNNADSNVSSSFSSSFTTSSSTRRATTRTKGGVGAKNKKAAPSWLLASPRFFNRVIESEKDFILYDVFQFPKGAIFVSDKTTNSKDPFTQWAATFLQKHGAPLIPIKEGCNKYLFEEVNEAELTDRCVRILLRGDGRKKASNSETGVARQFFRKLFTSMKIGRKSNVHFFSDVTVAFVHHQNIFIPEVKQLTRDLIIRVLNVCNSHLEGVDAEIYSCLMQAVFELLPPTVGGAASNTTVIEVEDAVKVVQRAMDIRKEIKNFLSNPLCGECNVTPAIAQPAAKKKKKRPKISLPSPEVIQDLTMLDDDDLSNESSTSATRSRRSDRTICNNQELERQIERTSRIAREGSNNDESSIIPQGDFGDDNAGDVDSCLRPSSSLQKIAVDESLGGGYMYCDHSSAVAIENGQWGAEKRRRVSILRNILKEASAIVCESIPSLQALLERVYSGYDGDNDTYEAFCDGQRIIVNFFAYMPKLIGDVRSMNPPYPKTLVHDFVIMITHELAHFLEPKSGHGLVWRDTHMRMVIAVMNRLEK